VKLSSTVTRFSTEEFHDAYSASTTFMGRIEPYSESKNPGVSSQRRILEVAPDVVIPNTLVIMDSVSQPYIVADDNRNPWINSEEWNNNILFNTGADTSDYWKGSVIRKKYPVMPTTTCGSLGTIGQLLSGSPEAESVFCYPYFTRRDSLAEEQSDFLGGYDLYFPNIYQISAGDIFNVGDVYYRVIMDNAVDGVGFLLAPAVKLETPAQTFDIEVSGSTYDPVTDSYSSSSYLSVDCFVEPLSEDYKFVTPAFEKVEAGDKAISVLKSDVEVQINNLIGGYRILSTRDEGSYITCHCRFENR